LDPEVARLIREERIPEAAALASQIGDPRLASQLYERACDWKRAGAEAMRAGDPARAYELAAEAGDELQAASALALLPRDVCEAIAARLVGRGHDAWAARALEAGGDVVEAAHLWERAGQATRAASLLEQAGDAAGAARVLESALRRDPGAWSVATTLGVLLARFGKHAAAVRVLQRIPEGAPERREALVHLVPALRRLGFDQAAADAATELATLGGAIADVSPVSSSAREAAPVSSRGTAPELHPRLFGRYDLVREVASSPSARVLECVDVVRGERVAVKVFAAWDTQGTGRDALARFEREVRTMRSLDHPNVVPCRDYVPEGPAIVLAWMSGGTLERMLSATGALAPARAVEIASGLLAALGDAHRLGILHRDVKPANVLFDDAGGARLSDFGVAHLGDVSTTATAGVFGTLAYMSPEQREGRPATARSDVFAVGALLREMITGERPSPGQPPGVLPSRAHPELGEEHDAVIACLTAPEPADRPADAFEARALLESLRWPAVIDARAARPRTDRSPGRPETGRLEALADGTRLDTWTGRAVEVIAETEITLTRALAFARADHEALQLVLRVDAEQATLWLAASKGRPLDRRLTAAERSCLEQALAALHAHGVTHGSVDAAHVVVGDSGVTLRFEATHDATATMEGDRLALARL
jgi:serine/threonine-protein kinase